MTEDQSGFGVSHTTALRIFHLLKKRNRPDFASVPFKPCSLSSLIGAEKPQLRTVVALIILSLLMSNNTPPFHLSTMILFS
jgi:hypothetical protein